MLAKRNATPDPPVHGGDLADIGRRHGIDPRTLLDFSANLNQLGPPPALLRELAAAASDIADLGRYPDSDYATLRGALARHLDVAPEAIVVGNGAAALLGTAISALGVRRCVVPTPAFSEDRHAIANAGACFHPVALDPARAYAVESDSIRSALDTAGADACLITNPHNQSGSLIARETVLHIVHTARTRGAYTIVDEAFIDYAPEASVTRDAATTQALVTIRSLTKFYAVPALRVGYAVCEPALARRLAAALPSWPVTTLAARAVAAALDDADYASRTRAVNALERERLLSGLLALGLTAQPSSANYLLIALPPGAPRAPEIVRSLIIDARIVVRDCSSFEGLETGKHIRVAVRSSVENARLIAALRRILFKAGSFKQR
jgi:threonine-phosphate decarboxylase